MLFTIIRDFFVQHVWGGFDSNSISYEPPLGMFINSQIDYEELPSTQFYVPVNGWSGNSDYGIQYISFGDWLSTTSTIITLVVILFCIAFFIRWIFKVCSNAILLR